MGFFYMSCFTHCRHWFLPASLLLPSPSSSSCWHIHEHTKDVLPFFLANYFSVTSSLLHAVDSAQGSPGSENEAEEEEDEDNEGDEEDVEQADNMHAEEDGGEGEGEGSRN